ncbi:biopolymer transporter ExbD [Comamonas sp. NLF-1-9]|uniref:ExbD/TolR family protein n=1 Tax=Comamonas sp. NLF-1-9 TaxID=2853163 RepID=UPI001C43CD34|nr:biopolymer transporter ExbD [Comamonas sp. NLF-1-9]QXL84075.1 biopolymer transporter ExbD [Comamonas sp. NLF-1-9]
MAFGRFAEPAAPRAMSEINVTPLVDVMLVLVVIFILAAPLLASSIRLELPQTEQSHPGEDAGATLVLSLDAAGTVFMDEQPIAPDALAARLRRAAQQAPQREVQLRADTAVPYGRVVQLIEALQLAGLQRIAFATQPAPGAGER